jgi:hypothetical protein
MANLSDRDLNLTPGPLTDPPANSTVSPTWIAAIVVAVAVIGAILYSVYGFTGATVVGSAASATVVSLQTDAATNKPPKAP